ncbi:GspH/FimT family pseudopilin [Burkholderia sp. WAC0059]|uniref:GspH/FimT family pseudopilin n=1 Tax=Burkholderia sp. WAC0059 TaxID=2066022 RepID=UPI002155B156|nr:GspH/FimT family pseudopilin [Burkholderia sp. WAC0059]
MLVVLVIVGIVIAVAALAPGRNQRTELTEEAQRLAALLESAADEAQVRSISIAWQPVDGGYMFSQSTQSGGWQVLDDDLLKPYRWRADVTGVAIHYTGSAQTVRRLVFGDESIDAPVTIVLSAGDSRLDVVSNGIGNFEVRQP